MRLFLLVAGLLVSACGEHASGANPPMSDRLDAATPTPPAMPAPVAGHLQGTHATAAQGSSMHSVYSSTAERDCTVVETDPETRDSRSICGGPEGYRLAVLDGDARMSIDVIDSRGREHALDLWSVVSTAFSSIGERVEWRYANNSGAPTALIIRFNAQDNPEVPEHTTSYLVVVALAASRPCVIAKIAPGSAQNERARDSAERASQARCLPQDD